MEHKAYHNTQEKGGKTVGEEQFKSLMNALGVIDAMLTIIFLALIAILITLNLK